MSVREVAAMSRIPVAERRALLVAAAWRVLSSRGVAAATTRAICAEAGMPQGAFHYCFADRDELFREVVGGLLPIEVTAAVSAIDRRGSLAGVIARALLAYFALVEADPAAHQVLYEITTTALRDPDLADLARAQYARYYQAALEVVEELARVRDLAWDLPAELLARQVVTVLDGLTLQYLVDRDAGAAHAALRAFAGDLAAHARPRPPGRARVAAIFQPPDGTSVSNGRLMRDLGAGKPRHSRTATR
jgi:AcrR family transcriptional regulator